MDKVQSKLVVLVSTALAVLMLLGAFVVVWLVSRGPETSTANIGGPSGSTVSTDKSGSNSNFSPAGSVSGAPITEQPHISVRGTGIVSAKPDMANLQVGVQIQRDSLDAAQTEAADKMSAVMQQLRDAGIEEKDISTSQYNVEPVYDYRDNQPPVVTGFRVTNIVNVKVRDIAKASTLVDALVKSGANTIYGISFGFSDPTALMKQAREQAMSDAKAKAEQLATLGGVTLGAPIVIDDGGANVPPPVVDAVMSGEMARGAAQTPINPGQQEVRVEVLVVYEMK